MSTTTTTTKTGGGSSCQLDAVKAILQEQAQQSKRRRSLAIASEVPAFVRTVYTLLGVCDSSIIRWSEDGNQVVISDPERFGSEVCPKFFRHRNVHSFTRLLNMYQFRKVTNAVASQCLVFEHASFKRDREDLLSFVQRKGSRDTEARDEGAIAGHLESALRPSAVRDAPLISKLEQLETQVKVLRDENGRLRELEKQRDLLKVELQQQKEAIASLLDAHSELFLHLSTKLVQDSNVAQQPSLAAAAAPVPAALPPPPPPPPPQPTPQEIFRATLHNNFFLPNEDVLSQLAVFSAACQMQQQIPFAPVDQPMAKKQRLIKQEHHANAAAVAAAAN